MVYSLYTLRKIVNVRAEDLSKCFGVVWEQWNSHTEKAVAAGQRDVPDSDKELSLKIRLNIRLYPWTNSYNTNKFGKIITYN